MHLMLADVQPTSYTADLKRRKDFVVALVSGLQCSKAQHSEGWSNQIYLCQLFGQLWEKARSLNCTLNMTTRPSP